MQQHSRKSRKEKTKAGTGRVIQEKFLQERQEAVRSKPLVPMNAVQAEYIDLIKTKPVVVATGWAGTSKSYIPAVIAAQKYKLGEIDKIMLTRPLISNSASAGFFKGTETEKLSVWLGAVLPVFKRELGAAMFDLAIASQDIQFVPLEVIKGLSLDKTFFICEEASDLTQDEVIKLVTRMGKDSTMVLAGDILQSELKGDSGLLWLAQHIARHDNLQKNFGFVDFNSVDHIVRSQAVKDFIISLVRQAKQDSRPLRGSDSVGAVLQGQHQNKRGN